MRTGLVVVVVVVIAGGLFWWFIKGSASTDSLDQGSGVGVDTTTDQTIDQSIPKSVVVTYSDSGFLPANITVNRGDSVVFKNDSASSFWPASDPHPTHTKFGDFDARGAVAPGQSYTFTFTKVGTWGYHDHLDSDKRGSVTVKENSTN